MLEVSVLEVLVLKVLVLEVLVLEVFYMLNVLKSDIINTLDNIHL